MFIPNGIITRDAIDNQPKKRIHLRWIVRKSACGALKMALRNHTGGLKLMPIIQHMNFKEINLLVGIKIMKGAFWRVNHNPDHLRGQYSSKIPWLWDLPPYFCSYNSLEQMFGPHYTMNWLWRSVSYGTPWKRLLCWFGLAFITFSLTPVAR